jgi:hypothetical protein
MNSLVYILILVTIVIISCCNSFYIERFSDGTKGINEEDYKRIKKAMRTPDVIYDIGDHTKVMDSLNNIKSNLDVYFSPTRNHILKYAVSKEINRKDFAKTMNHLKKSMAVLKPLI